jgi:hypothetical protein
VVFGRVVDAQTLVPLGFTQVRIRIRGEDEAIEKRADSVGRFFFCDIPAGTLTISGQLAQLGSVLDQQELRSGQELGIELRLAPATTGQLTGTLLGTVKDAETGEPIDGAAVTIPGLGQTGISNVHGRFTFPSLPPGKVEIKVDRLGFADAVGVVEIQLGRSVHAEILLSSEPIALEPIQVTAVRRRLDLPGLDDFERRLNSGWGSFILEEEIRIRSPIMLTQILNEHGVTGSEKGIRMRRTGCAPLVYVDGVKMTHQSRGGGAFNPRDPGGSKSPYLWPDPEKSPDAEAAVAVNSVLPSHVRAVEVYRGPAEIPGQYLDSNSMCGVILIWTRRGNLSGT